MAPHLRPGGTVDRFIRSLPEWYLWAVAKDPRHPMENTMGIAKVKDHPGRIRIEASQYWPDRSQYKRYVAKNPTVAKKVTTRIDEAIVMGTWKELKKQLMEVPVKEMTIREFAPVYLEEHYKIRNTRPDFKEDTLRVRLSFAKTDYAKQNGSEKARCCRSRWPAAEPIRREPSDH